MIESVFKDIVDIIINDKEIDTRDFNWYVTNYSVLDSQVMERHDGYWLIGYEILVPQNYSLFE